MIRFNAEGERDGPILGAPNALKSTPEEMLAAHRAGELKSVRFSARVYIAGPNRNHFRIPEGELKTFAASFVDAPFLKDHDEQISSVGGRIVASEVVETEDGRKAIRQSIVATKPWAIENLLDGTINRFSIGWFSSRQVCTSCKADFLSKDCRHSPYDLGKKDANGNVIELETQGCEGREVSAVVTPAVPGTGVEGLLRAKEGFNAGTISVTGETHEEETMKQVLAALGLPETAQESEVLARVEQLKAPTPLPAPLLAAIGLKPEATADEAIAKVVEMTRPDAFVAKADHDAVTRELFELKQTLRVEALIASGRIAPVIKDWALKVAKENPVGFDVMFNKDAPRVTALGAPVPPVLTEEPKPEDIELPEIPALMGVTKEEYAAEVMAERKANRGRG